MRRESDENCSWLSPYLPALAILGGHDARIPVRTLTLGASVAVRVGYQALVGTMRVRELLKQLQTVNPDVPVKIVDISGRGLKLHIPEDKWAIQTEDNVVFIRVDGENKE